MTDANLELASDLHGKRHSTQLADVANFLSGTNVHGDENEDEILADESHSEISETELSYSATSMDNRGDIGKSEFEEWGPSNLKSWLQEMELPHYWPVFENEGLTKGDKVAKITETQLEQLAKTHFANDATVSERDIEGDVGKIMREIQKSVSNEYDDMAEGELSTDDINEFERRLAVFVRKWQRVAWIEEYVKDADGRLPSIEGIEEELDVPTHEAIDLLSVYEQKDKELEIDLDKLFEGFDIVDHGMIWWSIVLDRLQSSKQQSLWVVLRFIAREIPTVVDIRLLEHFKYELTRFESEELDKICQAIIFGSKYPMCTAIRLSGYLQERAENDLSRSDEYLQLAGDYAKLGIHLLNEYSESDHLGAILLEIDSDLEGGKSAIELALDYRVVQFVSDQRVQRISSSLFRQWRFLHPSNKDSAFKVYPLTPRDFYQLMKHPAFYFTPLGQFTTETLLFIMYLTIFTWITTGSLGSSTSVWDLYTKLDASVAWIEYVFWTSNIGYVFFEFWDAYSSGLSKYFGDWTNYADTAVVIIFLAMMVLRAWTVFFTDCLDKVASVGAISCSSCDGSECICCEDSIPNVVFLVSWAIASILLWLRMMQVFYISKSVGPFIRMIFNMMTDLWAFIRIYVLFLVGFGFALFFVANGDAEVYSSIGATFITVWKAALGEWPGDYCVTEGSDDCITGFRVFFLDATMVVWMLIGAIVLLNLLIALMAKTFDELHEHNNQEVSYAQVSLAYELDGATAVMPPPANLIVFLTTLVFFIFDMLSTIILGRPLPLSILQPRWLRKEGAQDNSSGTSSELFDDEADKIASVDQVFTGLFRRFKRAFWQAFKSHQQPFDWVCKFCRQRTKVDFSILQDYTDELALGSGGSTDPYVMKKLAEKRKNSQALDPVKRLGERLGLNLQEIASVRRLQPIICNRCFRHRQPISRIQMWLEFISYWYFYWGIRPVVLYCFVGPVAFFQKLFSESLSESYQEQYNLTKKQIKEDMKCRYENVVLSQMPKSKDIQSLFKDGIIWALVRQSRNQLTPKSLRRVVERNILKRAHGREYERSDFYMKLCGKAKLTLRGDLTTKQKGIREWDKYKHASKCLFKAIQTQFENRIHVSHTKLFPFSSSLIQSFIEGQMQERNDGRKFNMDLFTEENLREFLYLLNVSKRAEEDTIIKECRTFGNSDAGFINANGRHASLWEHFVFFLSEVRRLVGRVRRIENMIRDVEDAANAHGENESIYLSHFHLVFEDIQNDAVAVVIFRSIEPKEESIKYGKVKHYLIALKQMRRNCDRTLLENSRYDQVDRAGFLDIVMKRARARDDDSDDSDAEDDDELRADTEAQQKQIRAIRDEANNIFDRIRQMNALKISLTQCFEFIRSLGKDLNNYDIVRFMRQRVAEYNRKLGTNVPSEERAKSDAWRYSKECTIELFKEIIAISESEMTRIKAGKKVGLKMGGAIKGSKNKIASKLRRVETDYKGAANTSTTNLTGSGNTDDNDDGNTIHKLKRRDSDEALIMPSKKKEGKKRKNRGFNATGAAYFQIEDEDDVPNIDDINSVYGKLSAIYSIVGLTDRPNMSTGDVGSLLHVLMNIHDRMRNEIRLRSYDMELTQELFCKSLEKSMDRHLKSDYNYKKPFHQWTKVARQGASVFQQVRDLEQGHVTLGQVRETLLWIRNDITSLCSMTRIKNKLSKLRGSDQMVDHDLWWSFLVNHLGVTDDRAVYINKMRKKGILIETGNGTYVKHDADNAVITKTGTIDASVDTGGGMSIASGVNGDEAVQTGGKSPSGDSDDVIGRQASQSIDHAINAGNSGNSPGSADDMQQREARAKSLLVRQQGSSGDGDGDNENEKLTNYERAGRLFDLMEDQNGSWITMRQIHCYVLWLTSKLSDPRIKWRDYVPSNAQEERNAKEISEKEFKKVILEALYLDESYKQEKYTIDVGSDGNDGNDGNDGDKHDKSRKKSPAMPVIKVHKIEDVMLAAGTSAENVMDAPLITTQISSHAHSKDDILFNDSDLDELKDEVAHLGSVSPKDKSSGGGGGANAPGQASLASLNDEKKLIAKQTRESEKELNRILRNVDYDDIKMFSRELSWIFRQCVQIESSKLKAGDETDKAHWKTIYNFVEPFRNNRVSQRVGHDIAFLSGIHDVFRDEFEQFKATLQCRGETALSLFYQIRHFAESVSWNQINYFVEFLESMLTNVEVAIDKENRGEDEDPNEDELQELMNISSDAMASWLFSVTIRRHSDKISWIELREYLVDWHEQRDEVAEFFEELLAHRQAQKYQQMLFDDINSKVSKIKRYFDENTAVKKDELSKKTKDELIALIAKSEWWHAARSGYGAGSASHAGSGYMSQMNSPLSVQGGSNHSLHLKGKDAGKSPRISGTSPWGKVVDK